MADPMYQQPMQPVQGAPRTVTPGFGGAILDAIKALTSSFAPRGLVQRQQKVDADVSAATGEHPQTTDLGSQF